MTKSLYSIALLLLAALTFTACEEDKQENTPRPQSDIPGITRYRFNYSLQVIPSSENGKINGVNNATITISQNGTNLVRGTDRSGIATFSGLIVGPINVYVSAPGFASINFNTNLQPPAGAVANDTVQVFSLFDQRTLPVLGCGVLGYVTYDADQNASTAEVPATGFRIRFECTDKSVQPNVFYSTVGADGLFQFSNLPESPGALTFDTVIEVQGQRLLFSLGSIATTPRLGNAFDVGFRRLTTTTTFLRRSGTLTFRPYGDFDYLTPSSGTFRAEDEVLPSNVIIVIDYSNDTDYPAGQNPVYTGTRSGDGRWTFANLPVNSILTGEVRFLYEQDIPVGPGNCRFIPNSSVVASSGVAGCAGSNNTQVYTRRVQFRTFATSANNSVNFGGVENQVIDRSEILISRPSL